MFGRNRKLEEGEGSVLTSASDLRYHDKPLTVHAVKGLFFWAIAPAMTPDDTTNAYLSEASISEMGG